MKKSLISLLCLASVASAAPYVLPSEQYGAYTPTDMQPQYGVEFLYAIGDHSYVADMPGVRVNLNLYNSLEGSILHDFNLNLAYLAGDVDGVDEKLMPITLGYDVNIALSDDCFLAFGVKAGISRGEVESFDDWGFTYSAGTALKYQFSDVIMGKIGYEFGKSYFDIAPSVSFNPGQHILSAGVSVTF